MKLRLRYFAWVRERVGVTTEEVETSAPTVAALIEELKAADEAHAWAFGDTRALRVALDQELAGMDAPLAGVTEVAFFPPMTGG